MKNHQIAGGRTRSFFIFTLILSFTAIFCFTSPAFAKFRIGQDQQVTGGFNRFNPTHSLASDNEGYDLIAWAENEDPGPNAESWVKARTYLNGAPIGNEVIVAQTRTHDLMSPVVCTGQNGIFYLIWAKAPRGRVSHEIYFVMSFDYGATWSSPIRLTSQPYNLPFGIASLRCNEQGGIYVSWAARVDDAQPKEIYFNRSFGFLTLWNYPV